MTSTRTVLATVLASAVLAAVPTSASAATPVHRHLTWCAISAVTYDELTDTYSRGTAATWDALMARGWHGIAGDHAERIYPPSCTVVPYRYR